MAADNPTPGTPAWDAAMAAKAQESRATWQTRHDGLGRPVDAAAQADFARYHAPENTGGFRRQPVEANRGGDILATAKTTSGAPVMGRRPVSMEDVVTVNGMDMSVSFAVARGFLTRDAAGNISRPFAEASREAPSAPVEARVEAPANTREDARQAAPDEPGNGAEEPSEFVADEATEATMTALCAAPSAASVVYELTERGELSEGLVAKLASDLRVSPAEASTQLTQAIEGLRAAAAIATGMTDPADQTAFDAWLDESPDRVRRSRMAARSIGQENDLGPLRKLVTEWRKGR